MDTNRQHRPLVSVIIPAYNAGRLIGETLDSVLAQTFCDREIIVVDDGSTDHTVAVIESYGDNVQLIRRSHMGNAAARNAGAAVARGKWLCFLDADDLWVPRKLELQLNDLLDHPTAQVHFPGAEWFDATGTTRRLPAGPASQDLWRHLVGYQPFGASLSGVMVDGALFERAGGFDESLKLSVDWDMWVRLADVAEVRCMDTPLVRVRLHDGNTNRNSLLRLRMYLLCLRKHRHRFIAHGLRRAWHASYGSRCMRLGRHLLREGRARRALPALLEALRFGGCHELGVKVRLILEAAARSVVSSK